MGLFCDDKEMVKFSNDFTDWTKSAGLGVLDMLQGAECFWELLGVDGYSSNARTTSFTVDGFEDLHDVERYLESAIEDLKTPVEFKGKITVRLCYDE